eukprot:EG_transcript_17698
MKAEAPLPASLARDFEVGCVPSGCKVFAGVDEAGRGPLAGPVVAAACIVPLGVHLDGITDSKAITSEPQREAVYALLTGHPAVQWAVGVVDSRTIDTINILQGAMLAMERAVANLPCRPDFVLVDGPRLPNSLQDPGHACPVVKGDAKCFSIAAASIIAKVTRDRFMHEYHAQYPNYNFAQHKGYPTAEHVAAVKQWGPCDIHRMTFAPLKIWYPAPKKTPDPPTAKRPRRKTEDQPAKRASAAVVKPGLAEPHQAESSPMQLRRRKA